MTNISTFHAAQLMARDASQSFAATPMGTLGNQKFQLNGGTQARSPEGALRKFFMVLKKAPSVIFSSAAERAAIREKGQELRAMKRCGHLFGKLTADLAEPGNAASVAKTLARMGASVPQGQGAKAAWGPMLEKTLGLVTDQDRLDVLAGVRAMKDACAKPGGVALTNAGMMILDHIERTLVTEGGVKGTGQAGTAGTAPAVANTLASSATQGVPAVKLTQTDTGSPVAPSKPSPLNLSESAKTSPPIPPRPPGFVSSPRMKPAGPSPTVPPRPAGHASTPTVKSADAKPADAEPALQKPVPSRKSRVADIVRQIAEAALKEQEKAASSGIKASGSAASRAGVGAAPVRVK
ncbi:hypothetical protein ACOTCG_10325 [Achromobacter xylosoxidans]